MRYRPTVLYSSSLPGLHQQLEEAVAQGCCHHTIATPIQLFFRADDIGVVSQGFARLIALFQRYDLPLCLAVVPRWLTASRYRQLRAITGTDDRLWCWHQHGRLHHNFEPTGKKQEFGPARDKKTVKEEITKGRDRLRHIMGPSLSPFFTPPWNRLSLASAEALKELGFEAVSRFQGAKPDISGIIPDIPVNVDLHTRKEASAKESFAALLIQLEAGLASGRCGIMLHHQRMNERAFLLLDALLRIINDRPEIAPVRFEDLLAPR